MARMNDADEVDFGPCECGHSFGAHDDEDGYRCTLCDCEEYQERDGVSA